VALLLRCWRKACDGEGQVVLLTGEPGIGKSRLTLVLREQIGSRAAHRFALSVLPYHRNSALYPINRAARACAGFTREDTPEQKLDKVEGMLAAARSSVPKRRRSLPPCFRCRPSITRRSTSRLKNRRKRLSRCWRLSSKHELGTSRC
jgi:predicted ATPase